MTLPKNENEILSKTDFISLRNHLPPSGVILPIYLPESISEGSPTSFETNKLIDSSASFMSDGIVSNDFILLYYNEQIDSNSYSSSNDNEEYTLVKTDNFITNKRILRLQFKIKSENNGNERARGRIIFFYSDGTSVSKSFEKTKTDKLHIYELLPNPNKYISSIEYYLRSDTASGSYGDDEYEEIIKTKMEETLIQFIPEYVLIEEVLSETELLLSQNMFFSNCNYKIYKNTTNNINQYACCNGSLIIDSESNYNGEYSPCLIETYLKTNSTPKILQSELMTAHNHNGVLRYVHEGNDGDEINIVGNYEDYTEQLYLKNQPKYLEVLYLLKIK